MPLIKKLFACKITFLLILSNLAVYLVAGYLDTRAFESLSQGSFLIDWGANVPALTMSGEYWRLFTSMFLHVGFLHLAVNMLALWSLGTILEARMRSPVFLGVYLLSGLCGSLVTALWHREDFFVSCGASGAILGIFGAALVYGLHDRRMGRAHVPPANLLFSLALTFGAGFVFNVDNAAHAGGLVAGALLAVVALFGERLRPAAQAAVLAAAAVIGAVALAAVAYSQYDRGMQEQIAAARFQDTLGKMGLLGIGRAAGNVLLLDDCIAEALSAASRDGAPAPDLRGCADPGDREQALLARFMPQWYRTCQVQAAGLRGLYPDAGAQEALATVDRYCGLQTRIYASIFQQAPADFDIKEAMQTRLVLRVLLDEGAGFLLDQGWNFGADPEKLRAQANALRDILEAPGELATAVVDESGCPYWSCAR